jgi:hypothetical protein
VSILARNTYLPNRKGINAEQESASVPRTVVCPGLSMIATCVFGLSPVFVAAEELPREAVLPVSLAATAAKVAVDQCAKDGYRVSAAVVDLAGVKPIPPQACAGRPRTWPISSRNTGTSGFAEHERQDSVSGRRTTDRDCRRGRRRDRRRGDILMPLVRKQGWTASAQCRSYLPQSKLVAAGCDQLPRYVMYPKGPSRSGM